jgi:hypothetical protein
MLRSAPVEALSIYCCQALRLTHTACCEAHQVSVALKAQRLHAGQLGQNTRHRISKRDNDRQVCGQAEAAQWLANTTTLQHHL